MPKLSKFKVVLVGDQNVGKTSIISRFIHDSFEATSNPTVGIDFVTKTMQVDGQTMRLQLWDTAGQQRFRSLIPSYVRDADCCLVVLDVSSKVSYDGIDRWIDFVKQTRGSDGLLVMIGNKIDLQREISKEQIQLFSEKNNIMYQEVSARNATNISLLFRKVAEKLIQGKKALSTEQTQNKKTTVTQENKEEKKKNIVLNKQQQKKDRTKECAC